jgi:hypothetical protein
MSASLAIVAQAPLVAGIRQPILQGQGNSESPTSSKWMVHTCLITSHNVLDSFIGSKIYGMGGSCKISAVVAPYNHPYVQTSSNDHTGHASP